MVRAMETETTEKKLSNKTKELVTFLKKVDDISNDHKKAIIDYFNRKDTGTPICKKIDKNKKSSWYEKFKNILKGLEMSTRGWLYKLARLLGDVNAVKKGKVGKRIARRAAGKVTGRGLRKLFK